MIIGQDKEVIIRKLEKTDLVFLALYANNINVSKNLRDGFPSPYTLEDAEKFYAMIEAQNPKTFFAIEYKGKYVGNISLSVGSDVYRKSAEIGYFIAEPFWNKGIAKKAVKIMCQFGFENLDIIRIYAGVFSSNPASQKVLEYCGFTKEGIFEKSIFKNGQYHDEIRYAIIKKTEHAPHSTNNKSPRP